MPVGEDEGFEIDPRGFLPGLDESAEGLSGSAQDATPRNAQDGMLRDADDETPDVAPDTAPGETSSELMGGGSGDDSEAAAGIASLERIAQELSDVERSLTRLDEDAYGICATCGGRIPDAVLAERPTESTCEEHRSPGDTAGAA